MQRELKGRSNNKMDTYYHADSRDRESEEGKKMNFRSDTKKEEEKMGNNEIRVKAMRKC